MPASSWMPLLIAIFFLLLLAEHTFAFFLSITPHQQWYPDKTPSSFYTTKSFKQKVNLSPTSVRLGASSRKFDNDTAGPRNDSRAGYRPESKGPPRNWRGRSNNAIGSYRSRNDNNRHPIPGSIASNRSGRQTGDRHGRFSRSQPHSRRRFADHTPTTQKADVACLLSQFSSSSEIDAWMQTMVDADKTRMQTTDSEHESPSGRIAAEPRASSNSTNRFDQATASASLLASPMITWTSRDETAFVQALREFGAFPAILLFVLHLARHPSVYLYTAALTALGVARQKERSRFKQNSYSTTSTIDIPQASLELLDAMDEHEIPPSPYTFTALFRSYCHDPDDAVALRAHLLERYPRFHWTEPVWEAAIFACAAGMSSSTSTSSTSMDLRREGSWEKALGFYNELFEQIPSEHRKDGHYHQTHPHRRRQLPSERIYVALFHVCASTKNVAQAFSFLDSLLARSEPLLNSYSFRMTPRLWGAILKVCAEAGDYHEAGKLMMRMSTRPNVRHCTYYLKALVVAGECQMAADFLEFMHESGNHQNLSNRTGIADEGHARDFLSEEARKLRVSVAPDLSAVKVVLEGCAAAGNFTLARSILAKVKYGSFGEELQVQLDEQCYHTVLTACDDPGCAKELVREMRLSRRNRYGVVLPNHITFTKAITVCRRAKDVESARFFLSSARSDGIEPDVFMYSAAIWTAAEAGNSEIALDFLSEMKRVSCMPTIVSYNGAIAALAFSGNAEAAVALYHEIMSEHPDLSPNFATFHHLAMAIRKVQGAEEKLALLWRVYYKMGSEQRRAAVGGRIIEALISTYGVLGHFEEAMKVYESITGPSDAECLRAILFACSQSHPPEWKTALSLLHSSDIVEGGKGTTLVEPGALCNTMLACSKADQWEESLQLLRLYGDKNASVVAMNSLIAACGRGGRADLSVEMLNKMEDFGLEPDELSFRNAIIACNQAEHVQRRVTLQENQSDDNHEGLFGWWECAVSLLRRMKERGLAPDKQTLSSAISACESASEWQLALNILQQAMDEDNDLNLFCFNAALAACEKGGAWVEALEIYERLIAQGGEALRPNIVTISTLVLALDKAGQKEMAVSKYREGIHEKFLMSPWHQTKDSTTGESMWALDLHTFSSAMARAAIRSHLDSLLARTTEKRLPDNDWTIIVGKGLRSEDVPVLKSTVQTLLEIEFGIQWEILRENEGRLIVRKEILQDFVTRNCSQ